MSRTLNLADHLLSMGRRLQELGRGHDALRILGRLARLRELPAAVAEEAHARLAGIRLGQGEYRRARRHLAAALGFRPGSPVYHHLLATALEQDRDADPRRAAKCYRRALQLDPEQPRWQADYGLLALSLGETEDGLAALRRAAELAPDDPEVLDRVVEGLCQEGSADEARRLLLAARFRNARDARFQRLWTDFRFRQLHEEQEAARRAAPVSREADSERTVLPFVRPAESASARLSRQGIRRDPAAAVAPPHLGRTARLPGRKHA